MAPKSGDELIVFGMCAQSKSSTCQLRPACRAHGNARRHAPTDLANFTPVRFIDQLQLRRGRLCRSVLKLKPPRRGTSAIDELVSYVCRRYGLSEKELFAADRSRLPAEARALVAWLALKTRSASLTALAQRFGLDISTLSHAFSHIEARSRKSLLSPKHSTAIFMQLAKPDPFSIQA